MLFIYMHDKMATSGDTEDDEFPSELKERLSNFDDCLTDIEDILKPLHNTPISELQEKMSSLDRAKLDLLGAYAMNSLFWVYLNTRGENPKEHGIKQELDRIRTYMGRVKEIEDRAKAPRVDKGAAKRFIRSALWQQAHQQAAQQNDTSTEPAETGLSTGDQSSQSIDSKDFEKDNEDSARKRPQSEDAPGTDKSVKAKKKKKETG